MPDNIKDMPYGDFRTSGVKAESECPHCGGKGTFLHKQSTTSALSKICSTCNGSGRIPTTDREDCTDCLNSYAKELKASWADREARYKKALEDIPLIIIIVLCIVVSCLLK